MQLAHAINTAWMFSCRRQANRFERATKCVASAQSKLLTGILSANKESQYGAHYQFAKIHTARDFQNAIPVVQYADLFSWIERAANGEPAVLTEEPIRMFEPTSGTSGGEKLIPYTASLQKQFQRGIAAWIANLFSRRPAIRKGRAYWSLSPMISPGRKTTAGIPIGFADDNAYLGRFTQWMSRQLMVAPPDLAKLTDPLEFKHRTLFYLVAAGDLSLISIWNPTFFSTIVSDLENQWERICDDLRNDSVSLLRLSSRARAHRADHIENIMAAGGTLAGKLSKLWPHLALVSCWSDGAANLALPELLSYLPHVEIQPKGLLATEAFVSFPLVDQEGAALAIESHFFEFSEMAYKGEMANSTAQSQPKLAHELERGYRYQVVVTTGGGLYRYRLQDEIEVVGFYGQCPLVRFIGKTDNTSDLVGEKLGEAHVRQLLENLFYKFRMEPDFAMLAPTSTKPFRYRLYLQLKNSLASVDFLQRFQAELQSLLEENPHYKYAIQLGQLAPLEVALLDPERGSAQQTYFATCGTDGKRLGNIKPTYLDRRQEWDSCLMPLLKKSY